MSIALMPAEPTGSAPSPSSEGELKAFSDPSQTALVPSTAIKNEFVLTKEEELSRVVKRAAKKSSSKAYSATRYDLHNMGVRSGAGDPEAAIASLDKKMGVAAIGIGGRSSGGGNGLAVLRCKGLPPSDFKHLARTVLSLDLNDEELGAVVAKYGDYTTGAIDSQSFVVELLRRGKDAKNASARALRSANASRLQALQSREQQCTNQLLATKPATVDFDFRADDIAKVKALMATTGVDVFSAGSRAAGPTGTQALMAQTRWTPTELRDGARTCLGWSLSNKQLGALVVMLLDHDYASKQAKAKSSSRRSSSNDFYGTNNVVDDDDGNQSTGGFSTTTAKALQHTRKAHDLASTAQTSAQLLVQGEEEEIDEATRKGRRAAHARLKALHVHESLRDVIEREGQVIVDPRALVALLRSANVEERHRRRQEQRIKQALPQIQAHANALTNALKPLEFNGKPLPSSKMAIGPGSSYGNTYGSSGTAALPLPSPAWLPQHMRLPPTIGASPAPSSSTSSHNYTPQHAPLRSSSAAPSSPPPAAGPDGYDESAEVAQVLVLESAINTLRTCALAYRGPRSISGAGLSPLNGQSYSLKEFRQVVKHTLGLMLSPGQVEALGDFLARRKEASFRSSGGVGAGDACDIRCRGRINSGDFLAYFWCLRSNRK